MTLFHHETGVFKDKPIGKVPSLAKMLVETDYGPGTELSHWDEEKFGAELMTGFKDEAEHVLPATTEVAALLGHKVLERLPRKTRISTLFAAARGAVPAPGRGQGARPRPLRADAHLGGALRYAAAKAG